MSVIIGVDPHKATHTAVAVDRNEVELARAKVRATRNQVPQLLSWAEPLGGRPWAIESAGGLGYLLSQQLVAAGETVLDVPSRHRTGASEPPWPPRRRRSPSCSASDRSSPAT